MTRAELIFSGGGPEEAARIEAELLAALRASQPQADNGTIILSVKNHRGELAAGLTASSSYGWLLIKTLWVTEKHRREGLARKLMAQAEEKGAARGCHAAWLDTSSPDARRFYEGLGYEVFGKLKNEEGQTPPSHCRWFMKKRL